MVEIAPPAPENPVPRGIVDQLRHNARTDPDLPALVCEGQSLSWAALEERQNRVAQLLLERGLARGDRVAMLSPNSIASVEVFLGTLRAGGCITPLSTMASGPALAGMLRDCGARILFVAEAYFDLIAPHLEGLEVTCIAFDFERSGWENYEALVTAAPAKDPQIDLTPRDAFNLIYSSGTTGTPKGILHHHDFRLAQMTRAAASGYDDNARTLISTPLYSNTTIVSFLPTLYGGSTVYLMPKFDARGWLELAEEARITHTMLVPVQYKRILEDSDFDRFDLSAMRVKFSTSAPLRADIKRDAITRFPGKLIEYYGLTEGGVVCVLSAGDRPDKLHTVGQPGPGCEVRLIDGQDREVPQGEVGEICGRSPAMMAGYFGRADLTEDYIWRDAEGRVFFRSGDMGSFDEEGFLTLSDRKKDMIISGGLNIYANDLELALLEEEGITDAAVIGIPSDTWGETPLGLVVLKEGVDRSAEEICKAVNARLGKSQRLSGVEIRDELPRSTIGKILKKDLKAPYWKGTTG
ncbi:MAG: class I adenylate-forming enzyme family protein [Sulfitobacter sp.]|nr:class I adenylate-forming enzyme family protein [Sulfitobacter sp.]